MRGAKALKIDETIFAHSLNEKMIVSISNCLKGKFKSETLA